MSQIKISNLTFTYPGSYEPIFENASFQLDTNWKTGFIGRNGRGKTTFLKLLTGEYPYQGSIQSDVSFEYFPYAVQDKERKTIDIINAISPLSEEWEIQRECSLIDLAENVLYRAFSTLSNGEQTKALLCALFLKENCFLLIDEPTNHLDQGARETVCRYLQRKKGFILVSHDRLFLDRVADHILAINKTNLEVQKGNFSSWFENKKRTEQFEQAENEKLKKEIRQLSEASARTANWSNAVEKTKHATKNSGLRPDTGYIGHKSAKMMKRSKAIAQRRNDAIEKKSKLLHNTEESESLKLTPLSYHSARLIEAADVTLKYNGKSICTPFSFSLHQGERIALSGTNGCGKSSLLKRICGENIANTGELYIAGNLVISYIPQDTDFLQGSLNQFAVEKGIDQTLFKTILRKLDFKRELFEQDIKTYSNGQKKKVLLSASLCQKAHLYIWDEPLNFIDIYSRMQIEDLILSFRPTLLFVEHDTAFTEKIATKTIQITASK